MEAWEKRLQEIIFPELELGRPDWDKPHTQAVVFHLKHILHEWNNDHEVDQTVLIIAAYAHDWGYAGLFQANKPLQFDAVNSEKERHMQLGSEKLNALLTEPVFDFLSDEQKRMAADLVLKHDKISELKSTSELLLMEADTLGGLDVTYIKPTFDKDSNDRYMAGVRAKRLPKFITSYGKKKFTELEKLRMNLYE